MGQRTLNFSCVFLLGVILAGGIFLNGCRDLTAPHQDPIDLQGIANPKPEDFSSESTLLQRMPEIIQFYHLGRSGYIEAVPQDGVKKKVYYRVFDLSQVRPGVLEKGTIVLIPGRNEPFLKYAELIWDLTAQGYSVYTLDHRGQGSSDRLLAGKTQSQVGFVEFFSDYLKDLHSFVTQVVLKRVHKHLLMLAHSMGGGIGLVYLDQHPGVFEAVALSSPMIAPNTDPYPLSVAQTIADMNCEKNAGRGYALGQTDADLNLKFEDKTNDVTHSKNRFDVKMQMFRDHPSLVIGGVSYRWLCEVMLYSGRIKVLSKYISLPILMIQAGNEKVVDLEAEKKFCKEAQRCQEQAYPEAFHEIFMEKDSIRNSALSQIVKFFDFTTASGGQ